MSDNSFTEAQIRQANPRPAGSEGPQVEWSPVELLSRIDERSATVETIDKTAETTTPWWSGRGLMVAAAVAVFVVLIGAIATGLLTSGEEDAVEPTPTTTPTTVPATTTTAATTTTVATTTTTTLAAQVFDAETYEATVTWDGEVCDLQGPAAARAGDTLNVTYVNASDDWVDFVVFYLVSGATVSDLDAEDGVIDRSTTSPPSILVQVERYPGDQSGLAVGETATQSIEIRVARDHSVSCFGGQQPPAGETQIAKAADVAITIVDKDQPLP